MLVKLTKILKKTACVYRVESRFKTAILNYSDEKVITSFQKPLIFGFEK